MERDEYDRLARLSCGLTGNKGVLPVAAAIAELADGGTISTPEVAEHLGGRLPPNRVLEALGRLSRLGAVRELPYVGRPHPRAYELVPGPFWTFVPGWAMDAEVDYVDG
jgi:hypothetical protein